MCRRCLKLMDVRNASFVRWVDEEVGEDVGFVVQEKVWGMPAWMGCDGREVTFGWRSALDDHAGKVEVLSAGLAAWVERNRPRLFRLHAHIRQLFPDVRSVMVYGELFGGEYPHRAVAHCRGCVPVREGVYYAPDYEFYAYDIGVAGQTIGERYGLDVQGFELGAGQSCFLSVSVCNRLFESLGIFHARTLFQGSFEECLRYPNAFPTRLPDWLDLPPLRNNWCAGIVIRPLAPLFTAAGERVLLKSDNSRLGDAYATADTAGLYDIAATATSAISDVAHEPAAPYLPSVSRECADMLAELRALFTPALLDRVRRETRRVHSRKETARLYALLRREVLEQFFQLNLNRYDALPARERQHITRTLCQLSDRLAREVP